ncbi:MAG: hypothetical protein PHU21_01055 [Elusimicrobia bacterium]|jgi:hypothetical protein|nr:hypothetical protein [Elusimicrobiota bacterium]
MRELAEVRKLLEAAADAGILDGESLSEEVSKLAGAHPSLAVEAVRERVAGLLRMAGLSLGAAERQEVLALAGRLGLSEARARRLLAAVAHAKPPAPDSARRPPPRGERLRLSAWTEAGGIGWILALAAASVAALVFLLRARPRDED